MLGHFSGPVANILVLCQMNIFQLICRSARSCFTSWYIYGEKTVLLICDEMPESVNLPRIKVLGLNAFSSLLFFPVETLYIYGKVLGARDFSNKLLLTFRQNAIKRSLRSGTSVQKHLEN